MIEADRYNEGKLRYDLIPVEALEDLAKLYTEGAKKYADRNWEKGMAFSKMYASLLRHLFKFWMGEDIDKETGVNHMTAVAWNAMAIVTYMKRGLNNYDDRIKNN
jgi:hypothetical protein